MTVLDANNLIFEWFMNHDSFVIERDFNNLVTIVEDEEETKVVIKMALKELYDAKLIKICEDEKYYILSKSFGSYQQSPEISSFVSNYVAKEINDFCDLIQDNTDQCDPANLTEKDLKNLCHIIDFYKEKSSPEI